MGSQPFQAGGKFSNNFGKILAFALHNDGGEASTAHSCLELLWYGEFRLQHSHSKITIKTQLMDVVTALQWRSQELKGGGG